MTIEDKLKALIGDLVFQIAALQVEVETLKQAPPRDVDHQAVAVAFPVRAARES